jgi:hypothetical protein
MVVLVAPFPTTSQTRLPDYLGNICFTPVGMCDLPMPGPINGPCRCSIGGTVADGTIHG